MNIIFETRVLQVYPVGRPGFSGGTELMVHRVAAGLAAAGHEVHVVTPDLEAPEHRAPSLWYWPPTAFPTHADAVIAVHNLANIEPYSADKLILASNGPDPWLGVNAERAAAVDAVVCFSQTHIDMFAAANPSIPKEKCHAIGLGVDMPKPVASRVPGRLLWASDPSRGLWHMLDIFEHVQKKYPKASLHVAYDFEKKFEAMKWGANSVAEAFWACKERTAKNPAITVFVGGVPHEGMAVEQLECDVFAYPCDPLTPGSELFCLAAMEAAAAGCPLVLSEAEALPEVFKDAATFLPVPGAYVPAVERRVDAQDWAEVIVGLMRSRKKRKAEGKKALELAKQHSWEAVVDKWDKLLSC